MRVKFYVLTSQGLKDLERHNSSEYSNIPIEDTVVIINSLDVNYVQQAESYCKKNELEYYITESNGTPAKGKNSVLDIFLASDNDYCVLVDGDDYLTPQGVKVYKDIAASKSPPDAVCLKNQVSMVDGKATKMFTVNYKDLIKDFCYERLKNEQGYDHQKALRYALWRQKYFITQKKYSEGNEIQCRVTWFSKEAAKFKFDEDVKIGEDALQMLRLKHEALINTLKMYTYNENPITYIYNYTSFGVLSQETNNLTDFNWLKIYLTKIRQMENLNYLHVDTVLPELKVYK